MFGKIVGRARRRQSDRQTDEMAAILTRRAGQRGQEKESEREREREREESARGHLVVGATASMRTRHGSLAGMRARRGDSPSRARRGRPAAPGGVGVREIHGRSSLSRVGRRRLGLAMVVVRRTRARAPRATRLRNSRQPELMMVPVMMTMTATRSDAPCRSEVPLRSAPFVRLFVRRGK
jgi:hypothetical protein